MSDETTVAPEEEQETLAEPADEAPEPTATATKAGDQPDLTPEELSAARWPIHRSPWVLETSLPGVFATGDVRSGSLKRVASAVGEGSMAVAMVHRVLHE